MIFEELRSFFEQPSLPKKSISFISEKVQKSSFSRFFDFRLGSLSVRCANVSLSFRARHPVIEEVFSEGQALTLASAEPGDPSAARRSSLEDLPAFECTVSYLEIYKVRAQSSLAPATNEEQLCDRLGNHIASIAAAIAVSKAAPPQGLIDEYRRTLRFVSGVVTYLATQESAWAAFLNDRS